VTDVAAGSGSERVGGRSNPEKDVSRTLTVDGAMIVGMRSSSGGLKVKIPRIPYEIRI
jgi:hypothetical protein